MLDTRGPRLPRIVHWGSDLGQLSAQLLDNLAAADIQAAVTNVPDDPVMPGIVTEHAMGWPGLPGPLGHRAGQHHAGVQLPDLYPEQLPLHVKRAP